MPVTGQLPDLNIHVISPQGSVGLACVCVCAYQSSTSCFALKINMLIFSNFKTGRLIGLGRVHFQVFRVRRLPAAAGLLHNVG